MVVDTLTLNGGTVNLDSDAEVKLLDMNGGTLGGGGTLTVGNSLLPDGVVDFSGGTMRGSGVTDVYGTLTISGTPRLDNSRQLINRVAATYNGDANQRFEINSSSLLRNAGTFTIDGNNDITGGGRFNNPGTFIKQAGSGDGASEITNFGGTGTPTFDNSGTVQVQTGTLSLGAHGTHTGEFQLESATQLRFPAPISGAANIEFNSGAQINGPLLSGVLPLVTFSGGNITVDADLTIDADLRMSGGVLTGSGTLTVNGLTTWSGGFHARQRGDRRLGRHRRQRQPHGAKYAADR